LVLGSVTEPERLSLVVAIKELDGGEDFQVQNLAAAFSHCKGPLIFGLYVVITFFAICGWLYSLGGLLWRASMWLT
jgi:hypothetical protein